MGRKTYSVNSQTITIETRWYEPFWLIFSLPLLFLLWFQPFQKLIKYQRVIKFCIVGGVSVIATLGTLWLLTDAVGIYYLASNIVAAALGTVVWFAGNALWTFRDRKTAPMSVPKTIAVRVAAISAGEGLLALFVEVGNVWYIAAAMLATLVTFAAQFAAGNWWIWKK